MLVLELHAVTRPDSQLSNPSSHSGLASAAVSDIDSDDSDDSDDDSEDDDSDSDDSDSDDSSDDSSETCSSSDEEEPEQTHTQKHKEIQPTQEKSTNNLCDYLFYTSPDNFDILHPLQTLQSSTNLTVFFQRSETSCTNSLPFNQQMRTLREV